MSKSWTNEEWSEVAGVLLDCIDLVVEYDSTVGGHFSRIFITGALAGLPASVREEYFPMFRLRLLEQAYGSEVTKEVYAQCRSMEDVCRQELETAEKLAETEEDDALIAKAITTTKKDLN